MSDSLVNLLLFVQGEFTALRKAIHDMGSGPDFITVDGAEGGTGAAPLELTDHVGLPLEEGLVVVRNMLEGESKRKDHHQCIWANHIWTTFNHPDHHLGSRHYVCRSCIHAESRLYSSSEM